LRLNLKLSRNRVGVLNREASCDFVSRENRPERQRGFVDSQIRDQGLRANFHTSQPVPNPGNVKHEKLVVFLFESRNPLQLDLALAEGKDGAG